MVVQGLSTMAVFEIKFEDRWVASKSSSSATMVVASEIKFDGDDGLVVASEIKFDGDDGAVGFG